MKQLVWKCLALHKIWNFMEMILLKMQTAHLFLNGNFIISYLMTRFCEELSKYVQQHANWKLGRAVSKREGSKSYSGTRTLMDFEVYFPRIIEILMANKLIRLFSVLVLVKRFALGVFWWSSLHTVTNFLDVRFL